MEQEPATGAATSKKDATVRRRELLGTGESSLAARLAAACAGRAAELLASPKGADLLLEAACGGEAGACLGCCGALLPVSGT